MGTFMHCIGKLTIPDEKWPGFLREAMRVLEQGGLFERAYCNFMGHELWLLRPPTPDRERYIDVTYSYFEKDGWENAGIDTERRQVYSGKIGWNRFNLVIQALYDLAEIYSDTLFASANSSLSCPDGAIQWLRYILDRDLEYTWRRDVWRLAEEEIREQERRGRVYGLESSFAESYGSVKWGIDPMIITMMVCKGTGAIIGEAKKDGYQGPRLDDQGNLERLSILDSLILCKNAVEAYKKESTQTEDEQVTSLLGYLTCDGKQRKSFGKNERSAALSLASVVNSPQIFVLVIAETYGRNFWELWWEVRDRLTVPQIEYDHVSEDDPSERRTTEEYLRISSDERLYWWREGSDVVISEKTRCWLLSLAERARGLSGQVCEGTPAEWRERLVRLLSGREMGFFEETFYEFLANFHLTQYRIAVVLLEKAGTGTEEFRRLAAVMANTALRKKIFAF
ncbi:MAG: hypothetical protein IJ088_14765 [Clostridia bacterium]|nr:hypothetical protein [Clostridia bacterium]